MSKRKIQYLVRGFTDLHTDFNKPTGTLSDGKHGVFYEKHFNDLPNAVGNAIYEMAIMVENSTEAMLTTYDLGITLDAEKAQVRKFKTELMYIIKRWAEKSRIKNLRGFRISIIKNPIYNYDDLYETKVTIRVIVGNVINYSNGSYKIFDHTYENVGDDLKSLMKAFDKSDIPVTRLTTRTDKGIEVIFNK